MSQDKRSRRKYFIKGGIQSRFIRLNVLLAIFVALIITGSIYQVSREVLGSRLEEVYPAGTLRNIYMAFEKALVLRLLLAMVVVAVATLFVFHHLAGPIYNIEQALLSLCEGDLTRRIYLRPDDELKPLAASLNKLLDLVTRNLNSVEKELETAEKLGRELGLPGIDLSRRQDISEKLAASLKSIRETLSQVKTKC